MSAVTVDSKLASLTYPRTGKRGVPQQFPRRLFEMLESETKMMETNPAHPKVIFWSHSGKAFRIVDVSIFSSTVLPRYFRTKKFSSFQRNLNLYGFSKVRRGPETDMYAHPAFVRNQPETLSQLRKSTSASSRRRSNSNSSIDSRQDHHGDYQQQPHLISRAVSPSPTRIISTTPEFKNSTMEQQVIPPTPPVGLVTPGSPSSFPQEISSSFSKGSLQVPNNCGYVSPNSPTPLWPISHQSFAPKLPVSSSTGKAADGRGRLDLLAMALEREAFL